MRCAFTPDNLPSLDRVSSLGQRIVEDLAAKWKADPRLAVPRKTARVMLGDAGGTKEIQLENDGEVDSFLDGAIRLVTTASIYRYLIRQAIASHPLDEPAAKVRHPKAQFRRAKATPRRRTEAELRGLAIGNARRAEEARKRRAAKEADAAI